MAMVLTDIERQGLEEFKQRVREKFPGRVKQFILFGSRARGDAAEDSDIDVLVLVENRDPELDSELRHLAYAIEKKYDYVFILSVKTVDETTFWSRRAEYNPFYRNVKAEGVEL